MINKIRADHYNLKESSARIRDITLKNIKSQQLDKVIKHIKKFECEL